MSNLNKVSIAAMVAYAKANEGTETDDSGDDDVTVIKMAYEEATGKALAISDELLAQILSQHKTFGELSEKEQIKFLNKAAEEVSKVAVSDPGISALVAKIDDETSKFFEETIEKILDAVNSPMDTYATFRKIFTKSELDDMPWPGLENTKQEKGDNRKPAIVKTTTAMGDEITTNWVNDFVSTWPPAKGWEKDIDDCKKELASSGSVSRLKHLVKRELLNMRGIATKKRNAFRSMVTRTLLLHHNISAIEMMPKVQLIFSVVPKKDTTTKFTAMPIEYGKKGKADVMKVTRAPKPFFLGVKGTMDGKDFSVGQITNMDVRAAIAAGGEMGDLTATIAKGGDEPEATKVDGSNADIGQAYEFVTQAANYFRLKNNVATVRKILADPKNKDRKDWLELIDTLYTGIAPTYRQFKAAIEANDERVEDKTGTDD